MEKTEIIKKFGLVPTDWITTADGVMIIRRPGIKKIQRVAGIEVLLTVMSSDKDHCALIANGKMLNESEGHMAMVSAVGSATPRNCDHIFLHETAEYRAVARVVLELAGLKEGDVMSEDEVGHQPEVVKASKKSPLEEAKERSMPTEIAAGIIHGEHAGTYAITNSYDDEGVVINGEMISRDNVITWDPVRHDFLKDQRSASDNAKMIKLLMAKGLSAGSYKSVLAGHSLLAKYPDMTELINEAGLSDIIIAIGIAKNSNQ